MGPAFSTSAVNPEAGTAEIKRTLFPDCCTVTVPPTKAVATGGCGAAEVVVVVAAVGVVVDVADVVDGLAAPLVGEVESKDADDDRGAVAEVEVDSTTVPGPAATDPTGAVVPGASLVAGCVVVARSAPATGTAGRSVTSPPTRLTAASVIEAVPSVARIHSAKTPIRFHMRPFSPTFAKDALKPPLSLSRWVD